MDRERGPTPEDMMRAAATVALGGSWGVRWNATDRALVAWHLVYPWLQVSAPDVAQLVTRARSVQVTP